MTTKTKPSHRLFTVKNDTDQSRWTEIGAAWTHMGNQGFTLQLDALPADGRIVMRVIAEREEAGGQP